MEKEDGEMSDDNAMIVDDVEESIQATQDRCTTVFKPDKRGLVVQKLEKVDAAKLDERARRFGLNLTGKRLITQTQIDELYENCGIESGNERHVRFDTIHLHGIDDLTTNEIFEYLDDYKPLSLEQIDYISCNVVCQDHISAALALLAHSHEIKDPSLSAMVSDKNSHHWREGIPHPKKDMILMRYATNSDKKLTKKKQVKQFEDTDLTTKNPWGDLCKSWGVNDHQEVFEYRKPKMDNANDEDDKESEKFVPIKSSRLAARLGKRVYESKISADSDHDSSDSEWKTKSKVPRMRMHADDEEKKQKKNNLMKISSVEIKDEFAPLSIQVANSGSNYIKRETTKLSDKFKYHTSEPKPSIQLRLGEKLDYSDSNSSDDVSGYFSYNFRSKVQKVHDDETKSSGSVWSRLDKNPSPQKHNDLRKFITSKKKNDDLRDRIGKSKKENLRIEIDNNS